MPFSLSVLEHGAFVFAGLLIYVGVTRLGSQRRYPSAALAWVMAIVIFPYFGVPLFLLLGTRKFVRPIRRDVDMDSAVPERNEPVWALQLLAALDVTPPVLDSCVIFHEDGTAACTVLFAMIEQAQHQIDVCTYVLGADKIGIDIVNALVRRARAGVTVRILLDAIGSRRTSRKQLRALKNAGVMVCWFMPILHNPLRGRSNLRYHRKLVVTDQHHLWSGGRNLASEYFIGSADQPAWIDLSFDIKGSLAQQAQRMFQHDWHVAGGRSTAAMPTQQPAAPAANASSTQLIIGGPDRADDAIYALLLSAAYQAKESILAVTPYFVPDEALLSAWCFAARRGVRVTLIIPARSNHRLADLAREHALRELVEAGASVQLFPSMVHAKAIVIDDQLALCGSANLDARSLFLNFELMTVFYGIAEIAWLTKWMQLHIKQCNPYDAHRPSLGRDILEGMVRTVGFQL